MFIALKLEGHINLLLINYFVNVDFTICFLQLSQKLFIVTTGSVVPMINGFAFYRYHQNIKEMLAEKLFENLISNFSCSSISVTLFSMVHFYKLHILNEI
jgi:hypothetical protein